MLVSRKSCLFSEQIAEVVGGQAEFVCTILNSGQPLSNKQPRVEIIVEQQLETSQKVTILIFAHNELTVIEADAIVKEQLYFVYNQ